MNNTNSFYKYAYFVLIVVFLVILAGSVVRTTQSGMGCPDWPKCFGTYIPPTSMEQVVFTPQKEYNKGQFVKYNDSLWYASQKFTSATNFDYNNWTHYSKHGYTKIVIYQTWIEYVNRLLGALLGILVFIQALWSIAYRKKYKFVLLGSILMVVLTGFQAWLGKTVVDSNLAVVKISIHLAGAVALVLLQLYILHKMQNKKIQLPTKISSLLIVLGLLSMVQFFMGVVLRQKIDIVAESLDYSQRSLWLQNTGVIFYIHRSFSLLLFGVIAYLFFNKKYAATNHYFKTAFILICAQLLIGIIFNYLDFPALVQPLHLLLSCIYLANLFMLYIQQKNRKQ
jgi:heme a synthase